MVVYAAASLVEIPGTFLKQITDTLQAWGITLPPFILQLFLLVLTVTLFILLLPKLRSGKTAPARKVAIVGLGLIGFGILWSWGEQLVDPLPGKLAVNVELSQHPTQSNPYRGMKIIMKDARGERRSASSGRIDEEKKKALLHYKSSNPRDFNNPPRTLTIRSASCKDVDFTITPDELRATEVTLDFRCEGES